MRSLYSSSAAFVLAITTIVVGAGNTGAQQLFGTRQPTMAQAIAPPRSVQQVLRDAERAIAEERWSDAVVRLGDYLQRDASGQLDPQDMQDYFIDAAKRDAGPGTGLNQSAYGQARRLLADMHPDALSTYELRYGPNASKRLDEALSSGDREVMLDVRRRYFHTEAGLKASILLAHEAWVAGRPLECSLLLDDVVGQRAEHPLVDSSVITLYRMAMVGSKRESAEAWTEEDQRFRERLTQESAMPADPRLRRQSDHPLLGGHPDRNGGVSAQMPLSRPEWMVETTATTGESELLDANRERLRSRGDTATISTQPLRVGDQVLVRTTKWLIGVDHATGKMIWTYPWFSSKEPATPLGEPGMPVDEDREAQKLIGRVWNDFPYGQISSDGKRLYLLDNLDNEEWFQFGRGTFGRRPRSQASNTLVALELETEGKLLWRLGAEEEVASSLGDAFFLGPPLPLHGRLYVMAEVAGDIGLYCLDPVSGRVLWRQTLAAVNGMDIRFDSVRRTIGAMPIHHEGLLICPTGAGMTVAVNLLDRSLQWARSYSRSQQVSPRSMMRRSPVDQGDLSDRWSGTPGIAINHQAILAPPETDKLWILNLVDGTPLRTPLSRNGALYMAGVRNDTLILVGPKSVRAIRLSDGQNVWTTKSGWLSPEQSVVGIGVFAENAYLVPTDTDELVLISMDDGAVLQRKSVEYPLGNLVAVGGDVFVQSPTKLTLAAGIQSLQPAVRTLLAEDPNDVDALIDRAKLLLEDGQRTESISVLHKAEKLAPDHVEIQQLFVDAILEQMRASEEVDQDLLSSLDARIEQSPRRIEFLRLQIEDALQRGQTEIAVERLVRLSTALLESPSSAAAPALIDKAEHRVTLDDWIAARIHQAARDTNAPERVTKIIDDFLDDCTHYPTHQLKRLLTQYEPSSSSLKIRNALFERLLASNDLHRLERVALGAGLLDDLEAFDSDRIVMLANAYAIGEMPEDAKAMRKILEDRGESSLLRELPQPRGTSSDTADGWPETADIDFQTSARGSIRNANIARIVKNSRFRSLRQRYRAGRHFRGWQFGATSSQQNPLMGRNAMGKFVAVGLHPEPSRGGFGEQLLSGSLAILAVGNELIALDMISLTDNEPAERWRREMVPDVDDITTYSHDNVFRDSVSHNRLRGRRAERGEKRQVVFGPVCGDRVFVQRAGDLICLDAMTGELRWQNLTASPSGHVVVGDGTVAVVSDQADEVQVFDLYDGKRRETRPWPFGSIWAAGPRYVLAVVDDASGDSADDLEDAVTVRLVRPDAGDVLLQTEVASSATNDRLATSFGELTHTRWMSLIGSVGELHVWDIVNGNELLKKKLDLVSSVSGVSAFVQAGMLLVMPQGSMREKSTDNLVQTTTSFKGSIESIMAIEAIDLRDGSEAWNRQLDVSWGWPVDLPQNSPLLFLSRYHVRKTLGSSLKSMDVLAMDVRDGKTIVDAYDHKLESTFNPSDISVSLTPYREVNVSVEDERIRFSFPGNPAESEDK